jgi:transcription elongation factor Elf1
VNCPRCGNPLPAELGQHAVAPAAGVVDCPNCGARVKLETGELEADVSPAGRAEEQGGAPVEAGRSETFSGEETVEGVMNEIEQKEQS